MKILKSLTACLWLSSQIFVWRSVLLEKLTVKKLPTFYGTPKPFTPFTRARYRPPFLTHSVHIFLNVFPKIHSKSIFPFTPKSYEWSLPLKIWDQNSVCISCLFHECYMFHPFRLPWFHHSNDILWGLKLKMVLIMQLITNFRHFLLSNLF